MQPGERGSIRVFRPENITVNAEFRLSAWLSCRRNGERALSSVNHLFTVTGKKLGSGRRTEPRIHTAFTRRIPRESSPALGVSTSDVGVGMKFDFSWSAKGVRPDARKMAEEAARRAGLSLSDWLNAIILQQAATQGIKTPPVRYDVEEIDDPPDLHQRVDDPTPRIEQAAHSGFAAYAPRRDRDEADRLAELSARLEQRFDQLADIIARPPTPPATQASLADIAGRRQSHAQGLASHRTQDLTTLENKLRRITDQIEALRRPGVEDEIAALRTELHEIARTLDQAIPHRAIEAIAKQIQDLADRIVEGQDADANGRALASIEYGLAEVRDALSGLTSSQNHAGYAEGIDVLAQKIDLIAVQPDPATTHQLENLMNTLRDMAAQVASNDTINSLCAQVRALSDKIEHLAVAGSAGDAFNRLELRIDALSRTVSENLHADALPTRVEDLLESLCEKIDDLRQARVERIALDHLENLVATLVDRLDAAGSRLGHLDAIERGLADLLVHIEDIRTNRQAAAVQADMDANLSRQDIERTQAALEALIASLDRVSDRVAIVEKDLRDGMPKAAIGETGILELTQVAAIAAKDDSKASPQVPPAIELPTPLASNAADHDAVAPVSFGRTESFSKSAHLGQPAAAGADSRADEPLEPGLGRRRFSPQPGARIVASEVAPGIGRPNNVAPASKSAFIAAARRAAQAASQDPKNRPRSEPHKAAGAEKISLRGEIARRGKGMLLAASIVAIVVGSIQLTSNIFDFQILESQDTKLVSTFATDANSDSAVKNTENETTASIAVDKTDTSKLPEDDGTANLLAPPTLPSLTPARPTTKPGTAAPLPLTMLDSSGDGSAQLLNPPLLNPPALAAPTPKNEATGTIARNTTETRPNRQSAPAAQPSATDGLPAAIGAARLRNAASAGDPAAAYAIAMRYLEGRGVPANLEEAARWFERAASKGLIPAQFRYASMLEKGQGVKKDLPAAQKLYAAAASKGHAKAMHNLAVIYADGIEAKPEYASAALWFRKAAEHGIADSQYNFAVLAARGLGTEKNLSEAYKWFALAAAQGDRDAGRKRDDVAAHMDAQALAAAQEAVKAFTVQMQPATATVVPEPPGGWDRTSSPSQDKPRAAGPLSISAFNPGKL
jgi:localization factor PodJL